MDNSLLNLITAALLISAISAFIAYRFGLAVGPNQAHKQLQYNYRQLHSAHDDIAAALRTARQDNQQLEYALSTTQTSLSTAQKRLDEINRTANHNAERYTRLNQKAEDMILQIDTLHRRSLTEHDALALRSTAQTLELAERTFSAFGDTTHATSAKKQAALLLNMAARVQMPAAANAGAAA